MRLAALASVLALVVTPAADSEPSPGKTEVSIQRDAFRINGRPTYEGRTWKGRKIEGLLLNSRMIQGLFDDLNPETRPKWAYPDTGRWDPERNTREFVAAMPEWRRHGLLAFSINLQGGSPQGYSKGRQPWHNSAITASGELRPDYLSRLERILDRADELGMVAILGIFYFGQDERLEDDSAVIRALDHAVDWVLDHGYRNVLIEVNNECNVRYDHAILRPDRVHELIERVKRRERDGRRLLVGTSYGGGTVPKANIVRSSDFLLMHGNGVSDPDRIRAMVRQAPRCRDTGRCRSSSTRMTTSISTGRGTTSSRHSRSTPPGDTSTRVSRTIATATSRLRSTGGSTRSGRRRSSGC